jgi:NAD(P)-dependent dehydrogenase (short-subunit alcohol dehydrogenase family)
MKKILITGANRGLGLEHTRRFVAQGVFVYATARVPPEADDLNQLARQNPALVKVLAYDATNPNAPAQLAAELDNIALDLVLFNAGVNGKRLTFGEIDADAALQMFQINALAPLKLAEALVQNVAKSERKIYAFQSSLMGSIGDNGSSGSYAYRISKCALNMAVKNISIDLKAQGVIAVALHPGWVKTRMGGEQAPLSLAESVQGQQQLLGSLTLAQSGGFFNFDGKPLPW